MRRLGAGDWNSLGKELGQRERDWKGARRDRQPRLDEDPREGDW